jgi:ABC-type dipeptide/oligopeptide/nickel transport system ATPase component
MLRITRSGMPMSTPSSACSPPGARIVGGSIELDGEDLVTMSPEQMRRIPGRRIATILQDPMASLDPLFGRSASA